MTTTDHPHGQADVDHAGAAEAKADGTPTDLARPPIRRLGPAAQAPPVLHDDGGDPVCWLHEVCPGCGLFIGENPPATCPRCGETVPA